MMNYLSFLLVVILVVTTNGLHMRPLSRTLRVNPVSSIPSSPSISSDNSFDFFLLVLQWDPQMTTDYFTLHGMWPENNDGSYPQNCPGPNFNSSAIKDLIPTLNSVWPSNKGDNEAFWTHEWEKHGTCSGFGEHGYFQNAAKLQNQFDVKSALAHSQITPTQGKKYSTSEIKAALKTEYNANPAIKCDGTSLAEIALCFSKSLQVTDCPSELGSYFSCPSNVTYN